MPLTGEGNISGELAEPNEETPTDPDTDTPTRAQKKNAMTKPKIPMRTQKKASLKNGQCILPWGP